MQLANVDPSRILSMNTAAPCSRALRSIIAVNNCNRSAGLSSWIARMASNWPRASLSATRNRLRDQAACMQGAGWACARRKSQAIMKPPASAVLPGSQFVRHIALFCYCRSAALQHRCPCWSRPFVSRWKHSGHTSALTWSCL
jgi:hypothetical protein